MEENTNKMENIQDSMKYYCRVCTTNTKSRKSNECIWIFRKTGLKSILEKYLQLQISEDDPLPKVICKVCFEKIEAIEFLRVIARRTETLLKDFLRSKESQAKPHTQFQNAYNSFAISQTTPREPLKDDEVVVNVSLSDPLTKDINKKLLVAQRKKECLDKAFTPAQISRSAVTSSPNVAPAPVTIVHQMPRKKLPTVPNLSEKRKKLQMALTNATTVTLENPPPMPVKLPIRPKHADASPPPLRPISEAPAIPQKVEIHPIITEHTHALGHRVSLGSIIKDEDLLRLILKALKWPVNNQTLDFQIQRLKNTNFSDIIVDPNLLQDTDLIQILGPLIHPTLVQIPMVPQLQPYQINIPPEPLTIPPATISYKLPAETSVQIITVPPEEKPAPPKTSHRPSTSNTRSTIKRRPRHDPFTPKPINNIIVVSDESDEETVRALTAVEDVQIQLDPALYPGIGENSNSNEAMLATLNRQREAMMRMHRIKRKQSLMPSNVEMVDDIMIVDEGIQMNESYPEVVLVKKPRKAQMMPPLGTISQHKIIQTVVPARVSPVKTVTSVVPAAEPPKIVSTHPSPQPPPTPTPAPLRKLPTLPVKQLPTLSGTVKKPERPILPKLPVKKTKPSSSLHNYFNSNTTLADADSTTKIVIKESKVPKPQTVSSDIEEQIIKVRIEKQKQKSDSPREEGEANKKHESSSDEEVVVVVEYEETDEEVAEEVEKEDKEKNENKDVAAPSEVIQKNIVASPEVIEMDAMEEPPPPPPAQAPQSSEAPKESNEFQLPEIEIKEEEQEMIEGSTVKEEKPTKCDDKEETTTEPPKSAHRSFVASKTSPITDAARLTRSTKKRKVYSKKADTKPVVIKNELCCKSSPKSGRSSSSLKESKSSSTSDASSSNNEEATTFRPARRSKTLSKYYKGPPAAGPSGRSMRSRT